MGVAGAAGSLFSAEARKRYLDRGHRKVEGWLDPFSATVIADLLDHQLAAGIRGGVAEIGIHHGKLFMLPYLSLRRDEQGLAIDLFEQQELNVDRSGRGDRERFLDNVRRHAGSDANLKIIAGSSLEVRPEQIRGLVGDCRFFSVDGGHTEECTLSDLRLADASIGPDGVVVIDDYFNPSWPEVSVGVARYMTAGDPGLVPFLMTPNKIFFCRAPFAAAYRDVIYGRERHRFDKTITFYDRPMDMYGIVLKNGLYYTARRLKRRFEGRPLDNSRG